MAKKTFILLVLIAFGSLTACATKNIKTTSGLPSYEQVLGKWSKQGKIFGNSYSEIIILDATYKSSEFKKSFVREYSKHYGLKSQNKTQEKLYSEIISNSDTEDKHVSFFISLYTPEPSWNKLHKKDSIWELYLEALEVRVEPIKITRTKKNDARTERFYDYIGPWSVTYEVKFPMIEGLSDENEITLILTGIKGRTELVWGGS